jgi:outer membrane protein TolC
MALEFKLPIIGQRSSETSLAVAELNLKKIEHKYNRKKQDLITEIESIEQSLFQAKKNIASYPSFILSSIKNRELEAQSYKLKTASIKDYIQAIENEFDAYNSQLKAKICWTGYLLILIKFLEVK